MEEDEMMANEMEEYGFCGEDFPVEISRNQVNLAFSYRSHQVAMFTTTCVSSRGAGPTGKGWNPWRGCSSRCGR